MVYRVIREDNNQSFQYDFDDIEDAREWVRRELEFDENSDNPKVFHYSIIEAE